MGKQEDMRDRLDARPEACGRPAASLRPAASEPLDAVSRHCCSSPVDPGRVAGQESRSLLSVDGLVKRYEGFTLKGVSINLEPGCVVGLVGSNGAGKTTVLKSVLGLVFPDEGAVCLFGEDVVPDGVSFNSAKQDVGVVFDACPFPTDCRVSDVAAMGRAAFASWDGGRWSELARRFNLPSGKKVGKLSRGMGMKLALAFALAHDPKLLILDEATAGLDPLARDEVLDILREFVADGSRGILMSSHITTDLEKLADVVICLDAGKVVFTASRETVTDEAGIAHCRAADLEDILASGLSSVGDMYLSPGKYGSRLLVPDRFAFSRAFPDVSVDRATLEDYMALRLKGERL